MVIDQAERQANVDNQTRGRKQHISNVLGLNMKTKNEQLESKIQNKE